MYTILYHGTRFGVFTLHEALKAIRQFYPGGQLVAA
jgi:hypothetical protein